MFFFITLIKLMQRQEIVQMLSQMDVMAVNQLLYGNRVVGRAAEYANEGAF
jgi:hypothetical protein